MRTLTKPQKIISKKIRASARGELCTLRIPGVCNGHRETTVFAHLPSNSSGIGTKSNDIHGVYACSDCHDWLDGRAYRDIPDCGDRLRALIETQIKLYEKGLWEVK